MITNLRKFLRPRTPTFSLKQFERLANIFDNAGQVIFGIAVISPLITGIDIDHFWVIGLGLIATIFLWIISVWLTKKGEEI